MTHYKPSTGAWCNLFVRIREDKISLKISPAPLSFMIMQGFWVFGGYAVPIHTSHELTLALCRALASPLFRSSLF